MASSILVVGHCQSMQMLLTKCLAANQHDVVSATDMAEVTRVLRQTTPDLVLADTGGDTPVDVLKGLCDCGLDSAKTDKTPIMLLDRQASPERRVAALSARARDLIGWPVNQRLMLARLRGILREVHASREVRRRENAAVRLGFAEETAPFAHVHSVAFVASSNRGSMLDDVDMQGLGAKVNRFTPEAAIGGDGARFAVDTFVVDGTSLSMADSFNTLPELRTRDHSRHAAILFIHDADDPDIAASALDSGASDILASDALQEELVHRIHALLMRKQEEDTLRRSSEKSLELAVTDELTGLFNRRYAQTYLQDIISKPSGAEKLTAMIVDIDHFKRINDTYGHAVGDIVLAEVARRMRDTLRAIDMVARFGGEEFLVVLPGTELSQAGPAADRLRRKIGSMPIQIGDGRSVRVTVSIGVSVGEPKIEPREEIYSFGQQDNRSHEHVARLLKAADKALYLAKETGRNRIKVAEPSA